MNQTNRIKNSARLHKAHILVMVLIFETFMILHHSRVDLPRFVIRHESNDPEVQVRLDSKCVKAFYCMRISALPA